MITFCCETCGKIFSVPDSYAGRRAACKSCGAALTVPNASAPVMSKSTWNSNALPNSEQPIATTPKGTSNSDASPSAPPKLPVRVRRLMADAEHMRTVFQNFPLIQVVSSSGNPPDLYTIEFHIRSLARGNGGQPIPRELHQIEIQLTRDYPRQSPKCRMLTPIFHPNIEPTAICVGDHWTAAERLTDLVIRIGEMLAYQAYNIQSPLDGEAAMWADLNRSRLPTDTRDIHPPEAAD